MGDKKEHVEGLGTFGLQIEELIREIVNSIYNNDIAEMPDIKEKPMQQKSVTVPMSQESDIKENLLIGLSALLPCILTSGSLISGMPGSVTGAMSLVGGIGGTVLQETLHKSQKSSNADISVSSVQPENNIQAEASPKVQSWKKTQILVDRLLNYVADYEKNQAAGYDITVDRKFGDWAQKFLIYANKTEDRNIARLADELITRLATMKIHVYDQPILNGEGRPDLPFEDYLIDEHTGDKYTEVTKPVLYSERSLLARGEIK